MQTTSSQSLRAIKLPQPRHESETSLEKVIHERRSVRDYNNRPLMLAEISQLLWAVQGITDTVENFRNSPSAGALYPLEVYIAAGNVNSLPAGIYKHKPLNHELVKMKDRDKRIELYNVALEQTPIKNAAAVIVISAVYERTTLKYGHRGIRYVHMEAGHAAQNVLLQATSLRLGSVVIGAFDDEEVKKVVGMPKEEHALYLIPVGKM